MSKNNINDKRSKSELDALVSKQLSDTTLFHLQYTNYRFTVQEMAEAVTCTGEVISNVDVRGNSR